MTRAERAGQRTPFLEAAGAGAALALLCRLLHGYSYGSNGFHAQFLPYFYRLLDPGLYPADPYVATVERLPTVFWKALALACRGLGWQPDAASAVVFAASSWAAWCVVYLLARALTGTRRGAAAGCVLVLFNSYLFRHSPLSQDVFLRTHLDATGFALPLALLGVWAWLRGRPAWAAAALSATLWVQPLYGAGFALAMTLAGLARLGRPERRAETLRLAGVFAALSLPALVWGLRLSRAELPSDEWARLVRLWYPAHYFGAFSPSQWVHVLVQGALLAGLGLSAARTERCARARDLCAAALLAGAAGAALAAVRPWRPLVSLQLLRLDGPVLLLAVLSAGAFFDELPRDARGLCSLAAAAAALCAPLPSAFAQACAALQVWARLAGERWPAWAAGLTLAGSVCALAGVLPVAHQPAVTAALAALSALALLMGRGSPAAPAVKALAAAALAAGGAFAVRDLLRDDAARLLSSLGPHPQFIQGAEQWVQRNTPKDAVVLCFPGAPGLRLGFRRTLVGEWIDGAALNWAADYGPEWRRRMEGEGYLLDELPKAHAAESEADFPVLARRAPGVQVLAPWDEARLAALLERYRPSVVVSPFPFAGPGLTPAFQSGPYVVYLAAHGR